MPSAVNITKKIMLVLLFIYGIVVLSYSNFIDVELQSTKCTNSTLKTCNRLFLISSSSIIALSLIFLFIDINFYIPLFFCILICIFYTINVSMMYAQSGDESCQGENNKVSEYISIILGITILFLVIFLVIGGLSITTFSKKISTQIEADSAEKTAIAKKILDCNSCDQERTILKSRAASCNQAKLEEIREQGIEIGLNSCGGSSVPQFVMPYGGMPQNTSGQNTSEQDPQKTKAKSLSKLYSNLSVNPVQSVPGVPTQKSGFLSRLF